MNDPDQVGENLLGRYGLQLAVPGGWRDFGAGPHPTRAGLEAAFVVCEATCMGCGIDSSLVP